jgi:hypothetical protein
MSHVFSCDTVDIAHTILIQKAMRNKIAATSLEKAAAE